MRDRLAHGRTQWQSEWEANPGAVATPDTLRGYQSETPVNSVADFFSKSVVFMHVFTPENTDTKCQ